MYSDWSKSELIKEIRKLNDRKKYGLVWDKEKTKEVFEKESQGKLPVLIENVENAIIDDKNKHMEYNVLIEGDNYHALSVLNYTHSRKIDVIYIDPPYNTGNGFRYNDNKIEKDDAYRHSNWLSFMSKRLKLAKRLLSNKGIIFISIDDNEVSQLKILCNEIFNETNFLAQLPVIMNLKGNNDEFGFAGTHEYILVYAKNKLNAHIGEFLIDDENLDDWKNDEWGYYKRGANLKASGDESKREDRPNLYFPLYITKDNQVHTIRQHKNDVEIFPISNDVDMRWRWQKTKFEKESHNLIVVNNNNSISIYKKQRPQLGDMPTKKPKTIFYKPEYSSGNGTEQLRQIFGSKIFPNPKPLDLIKDLIMLGSNSDSVICDFMAGSGTTGHAVLKLNSEDGGNRKFILCTNNEDNICIDTCYPRLKKVIEGYKNLKGKNIEGLGGNLKYFKTTFVDSEPTDQNKKIMVAQSTEMLCLKESCFELVKECEQFKIFKNHHGAYIGIVYYYDGIDPFKKEVLKLKIKINTYVFSLVDKVDSEDFASVLQWVSLKPIPSTILNVYRRIYVNVQFKKLSRKTRN